MTKLSQRSCPLFKRGRSSQGNSTTQVVASPQRQLSGRAIASIERL